MVEAQKIMDRYAEVTFDCTVRELKEQYHAALVRATKAQRQLEEYNETEEIKRRDEEIKSLRRHSLLVLSDKELEADKNFRSRHNQKCGNKNDFAYRLVGTGIGTIIHVKCPICGEEEDITDVDSW